jgi:predicted lipoprotein with Yx(FWY)xxD motif
MTYSFKNWASAHCVLMRNRGVFAMMKTFMAGLVVSTLAFGAHQAIAATEPAKMADTAMGKIWVNVQGMALYYFDKDKATKSNCNDKCAVEWPPLKAAADAKASGKWTIVTRDDGSKMWAFEGHPLYTFIKDKKPGQVTGDNVDGFHIVT